MHALLPVALSSTAQFPTHSPAKAMLAQPEETTTWIRAEFGNLYHDVTKNFSDQANSFALLQDSVANAHEQSETLTDGAPHCSHPPHARR